MPLEQSRRYFESRIQGPQQFKETEKLSAGAQFVGADILSAD
jgi:hypothetical protein